MWEAFLFCLVFGRTVWDGANYRRARLEVRLVFASASLSAPSSSFFRRLKLVMKRELNQWTCSWCCSIENIASVTRKWFLSVFFCFFVFLFFNGKETSSLGVIIKDWQFNRLMSFMVILRISSLPLVIHTLSKNTTFVCVWVFGFCFLSGWRLRWDESPLYLWCQSVNQRLPVVSANIVLSIYC